MVLEYFTLLVSPLGMGQRTPIAEGLERSCQWIVLRRRERERVGETCHPIRIVDVPGRRWGFWSVAIVVSAWGALNRVVVYGGCDAAGARRTLSIGEQLGDAL